MKYEHEGRTVPFHTIKVGEMFMFGDDLCLRVKDCESREGWTLTILIVGEDRVARLLDRNAPVRLVDYKLVVREAA
jgi:hypothetical protein